MLKKYYFTDDCRIDTLWHDAITLKFYERDFNVYSNGRFT